MKSTLLVICICLSFASYGQDAYYFDYSVNTNVINVGPSDYTLNYAIRTFVNIFNDSKRERIAREEAASKISILRRNYDSHERFPEQISDGWHSVIVTDNIKFCKDAKVLVSDNRIKEFAIENCIRIGFTPSGPIKKGKNVITLQNFNGEQLEVVEAYFINDMDEPTLVHPPVNPGYVTFWSKKESYVGRKIIIEGVIFDGISKSLTKEPQCFEFGTVGFTLKPGRYKFRAMKAGNDNEGELEVRSGQCLVYRLK